MDWVDHQLSLNSKKFEKKNSEKFQKIPENSEKFTIIPDNSK